MSDYAIQVKQILRENRCWKVRSGKGDHDIWFSPHSQRNFTVDSTIKSRHTANEILKQAKIILKILKFGLSHSAVVLDKHSSQNQNLQNFRIFRMILNGLFC